MIRIKLMLIKALRSVLQEAMKIKEDLQRTSQKKGLPENNKQQ